MAKISPKISDEQVIEIKKLLKQKAASKFVTYRLSYKGIAEVTGTKPWVVRGIYQGINYTNIEATK